MFATDIGLFIKKFKKELKKMKMVLQKDADLVNVQQLCSDSFCEKVDSKSAFF